MYERKMRNSPKNCIKKNESNMIEKNIIGFLVNEVFFLQGFIIFIEVSIMPFLYRRFYVHNVILFENSHTKILKKGKQNIWFLCKPNLGKYHLRNFVFSLRR